MANNGKHPAWTMPELNALEMLYKAGWRWGAIRAHLEGVRGVERSVEAVKARGKGLMLTRGRPRGHRPADILRDVEDLMIMDKSVNQIAEELGASSCTVRRNIGWINGRSRGAWLDRANGRMSRSQEERWAKERMKRGGVS